MSQPKFLCPKCKVEVNMVIRIVTEQPSKYYKRLPTTLEHTPETSLNSARVCWDDASWLCPKCRRSGFNIEKLLQ